MEEASPEQRRGWRWPGLVVLLATCAIAAGAAQAPAPDTSGRQLTAERAAALVLAGDRRLDYVPGEVVVRFRPGTTSTGRQRALMGLRSRPSESALRWRGPAAVLRDASQPNAHILAEQLRAQPEVQYAEPNYLYRVQARRSRLARPRALVRATSTGLTPNDADFRDQWNFDAIDLRRAWDIQPGGRPDLIVAVIDTGVTTVNRSFTFPLWTGSAVEFLSLPFTTSPELSAARLVGARDLVFNAPGLDGAVIDTDGHGTHMASTIAEDTNNGIAQAGIAYNARIMPVKACLTDWDLQIALSASGEPGFLPFGSAFCPTDAIADGIRYAVDNGAKVINISLGGPSQSLIVREALIYATQRGAVVTTANGNEFLDGNIVNYPAADAASIGGAMAVAATSRSGRRAIYSNTGSHTEIAAPGGEFEDGGEDGLIWQVTLNPDFTDFFFVIVPRFDRYAQVAFEGSSSSVAHVSGVAALLMSQGITSPATVEKMLTATARDLGPAGRDNDHGFGLLQARRALFGFGIRK